MEKKNPFVTTVGFKKDDPDHIYVAELLNSMGRGKAQYIVKAVLIYHNIKVKGGEMPSEISLYDYECIKSIVCQVLEEKGKQLGMPLGTPRELNKSKGKAEDDLLSEFDDNILCGIMASIAMFKEQ